MMRSVNWRHMLANVLRMTTVIALTGFVAWLPSTRTGLPTSTPANQVLVAWGGDQQ